MLAMCTECGSVFDSHDGGTVIDEKVYCPKCEESLEDENFQDTQNKNGEN